MNPPKSLAELAEVSITETDARQQVGQVGHVTLWLFEGLSSPVLPYLAASVRFPVSMSVRFSWPKLDRKSKRPVATMRVFSLDGCWKMDVASRRWSKRHRGETTKMEQHPSFFGTESVDCLNTAF